jgi:hypothetical protein
VRDDKPHDPFDETGESVDETDQEATAARTKASDEIDWLP